MGIVEKLFETSVSFIGHYGLWAVFILMAIDSCFPIGSEPIMLFAGVLVSRGEMSMPAAILIGTAGNVAGSVVAYYIGDWGGRPFMLMYGKYMLVPNKKFHLAERWFIRYGKPTVFFSRMVPFVRSVISYPAGIAEMSLPQFVFYTTLGSLPWCALFAWFGFVLGENWRSYMGLFHKFDYAFLGTVVVVGLGFAYWYSRKRGNDGDGERDDDGASLAEELLEP